jgi:hypothetical protein
MSTQAVFPLSPRETFLCTGKQLDAIIQFAEERGLEDQPLHFVVDEWKRYEATLSEWNGCARQAMLG